jgi:UDP-N-acetylmuramoylalanine--D-glutamate ligase
LSGVGAAILAKDKGYEVFVSDSNEITSNVKNKLDFISIPWEENKHSYAELKKSDLVIKSPGISNESEIIVKLKNSNVKIISEIEFASTHTNSFIIGITGSNGKTTTTKLIYHILKNSGLNVGIAGNIGTSFSKQIAENKFDYYVLEISSFQLDDIVDFKPNIAIITNLFEDHLDRYNYDFSKYIKSKLRITMNQVLIEALSVILQVSYFKMTKKKTGIGERILLMSPIHHHFQKKGFHESKIVS